MANRKITVSLPKAVLEAAEAIAARRRTSVPELLRGMLDDLIAEESEYRAAEANFLRGMKEGFDLGTGGYIGWTRDESHER